MNMMLGVNAFSRKNGVLKAVVQVVNERTINSSAERKVHNDKQGYYIVVYGEKWRIETPNNLKVIHICEDGTELLERA